MNKPEFDYSIVAQLAIEEHRANQDITTLIQLLALLQPLKPKLILEVGACTGGMAWALSKLLPKDGKIVTIDIQQHPLLDNVLNSDNKIKFIQGYSQDPTTVNQVKEEFDNNIDILFIDGDHSYTGTMKDFELYYPLVRENGVICFHDLATTAFPEPGKVWQDLVSTGKYKYSELFIHRNPDQNNPEEIWKPSIGIIFKKE